MIASFSNESDGVVLFANSTERIDEILERLRTAHPIQVRKRNTSEVPSDPEGPVLVVDSTIAALEKGQTPEMRTQSYLMEQRLDWPD